MTDAEGTPRQVVLPRAVVEQALEALEIGYDSAQAEAAQYHAAMAGYRPERHAEMDADVAKIAAAITALRDALEQQEQRPVAWMVTTKDGRHFIFRMNKPATSDGETLTPLYTQPPRREQEQEQEPVVVKDSWGLTLKAGWHDLPIDTKLYTQPPRREWQSLSEQERHRLWRKLGEGEGIDEYAEAIEQALKEKNND